MALEKFNYTTEGGKKIILPKFSNLPFGVVRKLRKQSDEEQFFLLFEETADAKSLAVIDELDMEEIGKLVDAWQKEAGVTVGESSD